MRKREPAKIKFVFSTKLRLIAFAIIGMILFYNLQRYELFFQLTIENMEMTPAMKPGQKIALYKHDRADQYLAGDIIHYKLLDDEDFHFARLIAKNHGHIEIKNQNLFVNGNLHKPTEASLPEDLNKDFRLKPGEYFIVHDQQSVSWLDSISEGPFRENDFIINGKVFVFWDFFFSGGVEIEPNEGSSQNP